MDIKKFIKETVFQIAQGCSDVIAEQEEYDVLLNPEMTIGSNSEIRFIPKNIDSYKNYKRPVQLLHLEMGVVVTEEDHLQIGGKIPVISVNGTNNERNEYTNIVKISIPICLPITNMSSDDDKNV